MAFLIWFARRLPIHLGFATAHIDIQELMKAMATNVSNKMDLIICIRTSSAGMFFWTLTESCTIRSVKRGEKMPRKILPFPWTSRLAALSMGFILQPIGGTGNRDVPGMSFFITMSREISHASHRSIALRSESPNPLPRCGTLHGTSSSQTRCKERAGPLLAHQRQRSGDGVAGSQKRLVLQFRMPI